MEELLEYYTYEFERETDHRRKKTTSLLSYRDE